MEQLEEPTKIRAKNRKLTADLNRIKKETTVNKASVNTLSNTQFRVFLGPFYDINSLQKAFNDINVLEFENIEIIKNEKYN